MIKNKFVFQPLSPKRNSEEIVLQIEESIISKQYLPKDRLPSERELAAQFNTGRGVVREALRSLEGLGLIYVKPGRDGGVFVKELDSSGMTKTLLNLVKIGDIDLKEITFARILIETKILELSIDIIPDDGIMALEENISRCEKLSMEKRPIFGTHQNFHVLLASFCKNQLLKYFLTAMIEICDTYVKSHTTGWLLTPPIHIKEHKAILNAIKKKEVIKAREALLHHLKSVETAIDKCR